MIAALNNRIALLMEVRDKDQQLLDTCKERMLLYEETIDKHQKTISELCDQLGIPTPSFDRFIKIDLTAGKETSTKESKQLKKPKESKESKESKEGSDDDLPTVVKIGEAATSRNMKDIRDLEVQLEEEVERFWAQDGSICTTPFEVELEDDEGEPIALTISDANLLKWSAVAKDLIVSTDFSQLTKPKRMLLKLTFSRYMIGTLGFDNARKCFLPGNKIEGTNERLPELALPEELLEDFAEYFRKALKDGLLQQINENPIKKRKSSIGVSQQLESASSTAKKAKKLSSSPAPDNWKAWSDLIPQITSKEQISTKMTVYVRNFLQNRSISKQDLKLVNKIPAIPAEMQAEFVVQFNGAFGNELAAAEVADMPMMASGEANIPALQLSGTSPSNSPAEKKNPSETEMKRYNLVLKSIYPDYNKLDKNKRVDMKKSVKEYLMNSLGSERFTQCIAISEINGQTHRTYCVPSEIESQFVEWAIDVLKKTFDIDF